MCRPGSSNRCSLQVRLQQTVDSIASGCPHATPFDPCQFLFLCQTPIPFSEGFPFMNLGHFGFMVTCVLSIPGVLVLSIMFLFIGHLTTQSQTSHDFFDTGSQLDHTYAKLTRCDSSPFKDLSEAMPLYVLSQPLMRFLLLCFPLSPRPLLLVRPETNRRVNRQTPGDPTHQLQDGHRVAPHRSHHLPGRPVCGTRRMFCGG